MTDLPELSKRERQIMDIVYARGEATATEVLEAMPEALSRTAVRTFLRILEDKGHLSHRQQGREYVFKATKPRRPIWPSARMKTKKRTWTRLRRSSVKRARTGNKTGQQQYWATTILGNN